MERMGRIAALAGALCAGLAWTGPAMAQDADEAPAEETSGETGAEGEGAGPATAEPETDWTVFVAEDPLRCWIVSSPVRVLNTRDGEEVEVRRGDILMYVSYWPEQNREGEVSFTGGYPFADDSTVSLVVGDDSFELFTEGEMAWADNTDEDAAITEAMAGGVEAVLTARSTRGTQTEDTFSLLGFDAALAEAEARCTQ